MDTPLKSLQRKVIDAYSEGLDFNQFYTQIAPTGTLPKNEYIALESNGFGHIPEAAANVLWQTTLGVTTSKVR